MCMCMFMFIFMLLCMLKFMFSRCWILSMLSDISVQKKPTLNGRIGSVSPRASSTVVSGVAAFLVGQPFQNGWKRQY